MKKPESGKPCKHYFYWASRFLIIFSCGCEDIWEFDKNRINCGLFEGCANECNYDKWQIKVSPDKPYTNVVQRQYNDANYYVVMLEIANHYTAEHPCTTKLVGERDEENKAIIIVDCDGTVTASDWSASEVHEWNRDHNSINQYYAGKFYLQNLNHLGNFNDKRIDLTACTQIKLMPGFSYKPTLNNHLKLAVNNRCLGGGNLKSDQLLNEPTDKNSLSHESRQLQNRIKQDITVYPNPNSGIFNLDLNIDISKVSQILITDITGKIIDIVNKPNEKKIHFNISDYSYGVYVLPENKYAVKMEISIV